ncbi:MAG: hypothetical protein M3245_03560, partial [Actinomycetota bacterium]|nr:hypothetical protein [Actinomycetota bacterium]
MAGPEEDRPQNPEDLFEDLDRFFAPIEEDEWLSGEPDPSLVEPAAPAADPYAPEGSLPEGLDDWAPEIAIPDAGELLGDEGLGEPAPPAAEPSAAGPDIWAPQEGDGSPRPAGEAWMDDPSVASQADWDRLRQDDDDLLVAQAETETPEALVPEPPEGRPEPPGTA